MHLVEILIDKRVSCEFIDAQGTENVIFCRPIEESLNNIAAITTKSSEFIHSFITEATGENYLVTNIKLPGGKVYNDVRFKLITCESGELPQSTIDTSILGIPAAFDETSPNIQILNEVVLPVEAVVEQDDTVYQEHVYNSSNSSNSVIIEQVKELEARLVKQQQKLRDREEQLKSRQDAVELNEKLQKTLEDYKSELLVEYYSVSDKQQNILSSQLNDLSSSLFKYVKEKLKDQKINNETLLKELSNESIKILQSEQDAAINEIKSEISSLLSERIKENTESTDRRLVERAGELQQLFSEKLILQLEDHKQEIKEEIESINCAIDSLVEGKLKIAVEATDKQLVSRAGDLQTEFASRLQNDLSEHKAKLFEEFKQVSTETSESLFSKKTDELNKALEELLSEHKQTLDNTISQKITEVSTTVNAFKVDVEGKLPKLDKTIEDINSRINTLLQEKRAVQTLVDSAKQYTDTAVARASQDAKDYARRILDLGGGGGSNAAQYAQGGVINGDLNVIGQYLSGGVNIISILSGGGGGGGDGRADVNTVVISGSANWNDTYTTVQANSATAWNYQGSDLKALSGNWENTYTSWSNASATSIVDFNDTRFAKLSAQVYQAGSGASSIQPISGNNTASGISSNVVGGQFNTASGDYSNVAGGWCNNAPGLYSSVLGGTNNNACGYISNVAGGVTNNASGDFSNIGGGRSNIASGPYSNVSGGCSNTASGYYSAAINGNGNTSCAYYSFIGNGSGNTASGSSSFIGSGSQNTASGYVSVVVSGEQNCAFGNHSFIGSGSLNTASGNCSGILGGCCNTVTHNNSFAIGSNITSSADNTTYVNNISSSGSVYGTFYGDGSNLTGIVTNSYIYQQSNFNSSIGKYYLVDTSTNVVNVTLPSSPQVGDVIVFEDFAGTWAIAPMILLNNGNLIESYNTPLTANLNSFNFKLIYTGATYGWRLY